jgi:hypothetical protein
MQARRAAVCACSISENSGVAEKPLSARGHAVRVGGAAGRLVKASPAPAPRAALRFLLRCNGDGGEEGLSPAGTVFAGSRFNEISPRIRWVQVHSHFLFGVT